MELHPDIPTHIHTVYPKIYFEVWTTHSLWFQNSCAITDKIIFPNFTILYCWSKTNRTIIVGACLSAALTLLSTSPRFSGLKCRLSRCWGSMPAEHTNEASMSLVSSNKEFLERRFAAQFHSFTFKCHSLHFGHCGCRRLLIVSAIWEKFFHHWPSHTWTHLDFHSFFKLFVALSGPFISVLLVAPEMPHPSLLQVGDPETGCSVEAQTCALGSLCGADGLGDAPPLWTQAHPRAPAHAL